jgi:hypothetical protein
LKILTQANNNALNGEQKNAAIAATKFHDERKDALVPAQAAY